MDYVFICLVAFVFAALTMFSGFGLGTLLMPAFAIFFPVEIAVTATAVVHLLNNFFKLWLWGWHARPSTVFRFAIPAALFAFVGAWLSTQFKIGPITQFTVSGFHVEISPLKIFLAIVIVGVALMEFLPKLSERVVPVKYFPIGGAACGLLGGLSGHHATLRTAFLMRTDLSKEAFIATGIGTSVVIDISRLLVYGSAFFSDAWVQFPAHDAVGVVIAASFAAFAGTIVGSQLIDNITYRAVKVTIAVMLLMMAGGLVTGMM